MHVLLILGLGNGSGGHIFFIFSNFIMQIRNLNIFTTTTLVVSFTFISCTHYEARLYGGECSKPVYTEDKSEDSSRQSQINIELGSFISYEGKILNYDIVNRFVLENQKELELPVEFLCPITKQLMVDPVVAADGYTYERWKIEPLLDKTQISPYTGAVLLNKNLTANHIVKQMITSFLKRMRESIVENSDLRNRIVAMEKESYIIKNYRFKTYDNLAEELKKDLTDIFEHPDKEWDNRNDEEKYFLLKKYQLLKFSYATLSPTFIVKLSNETQLNRHQINLAGNKHPSTEEYWNMNEVLQLEWIKNM
jgi:hypothetical protein